ncbi:hypothetical protein FJ250_03690 [bacterium]|nr:hypothetical protein [bacterium]
MSDCVPVAELAALAGLPESDARRRHVEACARCRAAWLEYRDFMDGDGALRSAAGPIDHAARAALDRAIATACAPPRRRAFASLRLVTPVAAAAVLAVVLLASREEPGPSPNAAPVLRGDAEAGSLLLHAARSLPDGAVELRWNSLAGATAYRVRFQGTDGARLGESSSRTDTTFVLRPEALPAWLPASGTVAWRVVASRETGDVVSAPGLVTVPSGR